MLSLLLTRKNITGENKKKTIIFCKAISSIYHSRTSQKGVTREELHKYFRKNSIYYSPSEISAFLQYLKENNIITNYEKDYWVTLY